MFDEEELLPDDEYERDSERLRRLEAENQQEPKDDEDVRPEDALGCRRCNVPMSSCCGCGFCDCPMPICLICLWDQEGILR